MQSLPAQVSAAMEAGRQLVSACAAARRAHRDQRHGRFGGGGRCGPCGYIERAARAFAGLSRLPFAGIPGFVNARFCQQLFREYGGDSGCLRTGAGGGCFHRLSDVRRQTGIPGRRARISGDTVGAGIAAAGCPRLFCSAAAQRSGSRGTGAGHDGPVARDGGTADPVGSPIWPRECRKPTIRPSVSPGLCTAGWLPCMLPAPTSSRLPCAGADRSRRTQRTSPFIISYPR